MLPTAAHSASATQPQVLNRWVRAGDHTVMALAIVLSAGSILLFAWSGRPHPVQLGLTPSAALVWNALLPLLFFVQHSVMVRRSVRARLAVLRPAHYDGAFYAISSGLVLTMVVILYQPVELAPLYVLHGPARLLIIAIALLALALIVWTARSLPGFDPCGLRPIRQHLHQGLTPAQDAPFRAKAFVVDGPFRWVRHPLYSAIIIIFWATPHMSVARFEDAMLWTAWICLGAVLEERDLRTDFGEAYRRYAAQVPFLVPWRLRSVPRTTG